MKFVTGPHNNLTAAEKGLIRTACSYSSSAYASYTESFSFNSIESEHLYQTHNLMPVFNDGLDLLSSPHSPHSSPHSYGNATFFSHTPQRQPDSRTMNQTIFRGLTRENLAQSNAQLKKIKDAKDHSNSAGDGKASSGDNDVVLKIKGIAKSVDKIIEGGRLVNDKDWAATRRELRARKDLKEGRPEPSPTRQVERKEMARKETVRRARTQLEAAAIHSTSCSATNSNGAHPLASQLSALQDVVLALQGQCLGPDTTESGSLV